MVRVLFGALTLIALLGVPAAARSQTAAGLPAVQAMELAAGAPIALTHSRLTGLVTFMATPKAPIASSLPAAAGSEARARAFLTSYGAAFGVGSPTNLARLRSHGPDTVRMEHVRFRQLHGGVPVTAGELTVHLRGSDVVAVNARTLVVPSTIATTPAISAASALAAGRALVARQFGITDAAFSAPRLEIFNRGMLEGRPAPTRLAWFMEATRIDFRQYIWIDAQTGLRLLDFSQLTDGLSRSIYTANRRNFLPGTFLRSEGQPATGDLDADAAYTFAGDTYDYFLMQHGRDSYDGAGAPIISTVHWCPFSFPCDFPNAFWNGVQMVYGEGFPVADDVDAHELTHAVTEHSAGLFYYMQSGALNESFSDIFGETVDLLNGAGTDTPAARWLVGEDIPGIGAVRNMIDPPAFANPGKMSDPLFVCEVDPPRSDQGGVHSNSGVPNHAYALMVDGGTYNGFTIAGIGLIKAGKIQYRALTTYLLSASDFVDNYHALKQSCADLVGTDGITADDCTEVGKALDAVEMSAPWPCTPLQAEVPDFCPAGQNVSSVFFDDLEDPSSEQWAISTLSGIGAWFYPPPPNRVFATSGVQNFWGNNQGSIGDSAIGMTHSVPIPATGARLQFNHSYGFENGAFDNFDGGVIEYSTNGGASWVDAGNLIAAGATYGGVIASGFGNPLGGRSAFVRDSFGYTASQLDLSSLGGQNIRFRFRMGSDSSLNDYGWFIDDVAIYQCVVETVPPTISKAFGAATLTVGGTTTLTFTVTNPNATPVSGIGVTDSLPAGLVVATPSEITGSCGGGTITAAAGSSTVALSAATLAAGATCTFGVNVTGTTTGLKTNVTGNVTSTETGNGGAATASLTVTGPVPPAVSKAFAAATVTVGGTTTLTFTVTNPNAMPLGGIGVTDSLPSGLIVATPSALTGSCGDGTIMATAGSATIALSGATLAAGATCTFGVNVTGTTTGLKTNVTGNVTSAETGNGGTAIASLTVTPPDATYSFGAAGAFTVSETTATATITVTRAGSNLTAGATVQFQTIPGGTAIEGTHYTAVTRTLTFAAGQTSATGTVPIIDNTALDGSRTVSLVLLDPGPGTLIGEPSSSVLTITDNEQGGVVQFGAATYRASESPGGTFNVSVVRSGVNLGSGVLVDYAVTGGTATGGGMDYTLANGTLTFAAGQTAAAIPVTIVNEGVPEGDETVVVTLGNPRGATLGTVLVTTLTITDDGQPLQFGAPTYTAPEGAASAAIAVTRSGPVSTTVTVRCRTVPGGTAAAGQDYQDVVRTLTFGPNVRTQTCLVPIVNNTRADGPRTVKLELDTPGGPGAVLGTTTAAELTINDNDQAGVIKFVLASQNVAEGQTAMVMVSRTGVNLAGNVTVDYVVTGGTAVNGLVDVTLPARTLTFKAGQTSAVIPVPTVNDTLAEGVETVIVTLQNPTGGASVGTPAVTTLNITDNDNAGVLQFSSAAYSVAENVAGGLMNLVVTRTGSSLASDVTVDYEVTGGTATNDTDYVLVKGTLTFGAGQMSRPIPVTIVNDDLSEGAETVVVTLSNPRGMATLGLVRVTTLTIQDNEQALFFSAPAYAVLEGTASAAIGVARSGLATTAVTVVCRTVPGGTAIAGEDYQDVVRTLTFGPNVRTQTCLVPIVNDTRVDGPRTVNLQLDTPGGVGANLGTTTAAVLTIRDNDQGGIIKFVLGSQTVAEGQTALVTVSRTGVNLAGNVSVDYAVTGGSAVNGLVDVTLPGGTLTFKAGQTSAVIRVPTVNDTLAEAVETVIVTLLNPTGGASLGTPAVTTLNLTDNDNAGVLQFSSAAYSVAENIASGLFNLVVTRTGTNLASGVTVDYTVTGGTATGSVDYALASGTLTFAVGQTSQMIPVTILDDALPEGSETVVVTLGNPTGRATLGAVRVTTLTIQDDEQTLTFSAPSYVVTEGTASMAIPIMRAGPTPAGTKVMCQTLDGVGTAVPNIDYRPVTTTLTFAAGARTVTCVVPILNDTALDGPRTVNLGLAIPPGGSGLPGTPSTAVLTVNDNEQGGTIRFGAATYSVSEGGKGLVTVTRSGANLAQDVTVGYAVTGGSATNGSDYDLADGTLTFGAGLTSATIEVPTFTDAVFDGNQTVVLTLSGPSAGASLGSQTTTVLTIREATKPAQVRFHNDLVVCSAVSCQAFTARLRAEEGYVWTARSGATSAYQSVRHATLSNFIGDALEFPGAPPLSFPGAFSILPNGRYLLVVTFDGSNVVLFQIDESLPGAAVSASGLGERGIAAATAQGSPGLRFAPLHELTPPR